MQQYTFTTNVFDIITSYFYYDIDIISYYIFFRKYNIHIINTLIFYSDILKTFC